MFIPLLNKIYGHNVIVPIILQKLYSQIYILKPALKLNVDYSKTNHLTFEEWDNMISSSLKKNEKLTISAIMNECYKNINKALADSFINYIIKKDISLLPITKVCYLKVLSSHMDYHHLYVHQHIEIMKDDSITKELKKFVKNNKTLRLIYKKLKRRMNIAPILYENEFKKKSSWYNLKNMEKKEVIKRLNNADYINSIIDTSLMEKDLSLSCNFMRELLFHLNKYNININEDYVKRIVKWLNISNIQHNIVEILNNEQCSSCGTKLKCHECVTEADVTLLKNFIENGIIKKDNINLRTNFSEWENFKKFLSNLGKLDLVIDGQNYNNLCKGVQVVVPNITKKSKILVILSPDIYKKITSIFKPLTDSCYVFVFNWKTEDDLFTLYAALNSGLGTKVVSSDYFLRHKFYFAKQNLGRKFSDWQKYHQLFKPKFSSKYQPCSIYYRTQFDYQTKTYHLKLGTPSILHTEGLWICSKLKHYSENKKES